MQLGDIVEFPRPFDDGEPEVTAVVSGFPEVGRVALSRGVTTIGMPTDTLREVGPNRWRWMPPWEGS